VKILSRYIAKELTKVIAICLAAFTALYLLVDLLDRIDDFLEVRLPLSRIGEYFLLKAPLALQQGIPLAVLMGTLIALGLIARANELTALKAHGVSPLLYLTPAILLALLFGFSDFLLAEYIVPSSTSRANYIWNVEVKGRPLVGSFTNEQIWYKSGPRIYNIRVLHSERSLLEGVTIYFFDNNFHLLKRLDARKALWNGKKWLFSEGILLTRRDKGIFNLKHFQELSLDLPERPQNFQRLEKPTEEMSFAELLHYVRRIESEGYDATRYRVDLQAKLSFPFTTVILSLLGIAVILVQGKRGGIALGVVVSIAFAFVFLVLSQVLITLGYTGSLQPLLAAWTPNLFFGLAALLLLAHAKL